MSNISQIIILQRLLDWLKNQLNHILPVKLLLECSYQKKPFSNKTRERYKLSKNYCNYKLASTPTSKPTINKEAKIPPAFFPALLLIPPLSLLALEFIFAP